MHYLTFAVAYLFVLLNANLYFDHMFTMRIPLYIYILLSMFFPYAKYYNLKMEIWRWLGLTDDQSDYGTEVSC